MWGQIFTNNEFSKHFGGCQQFKAEFEEFDSKCGALLKAYSEPKEKLLIVRFLLKHHYVVIDKKLKNYPVQREEEENSSLCQICKTNPNIL